MTMMKADESNDSGFDVANGSLEEIKQEPLVVVDGESNSDKSYLQTPVKSEMKDKSSSANSPDTAVSNLSPESFPNFHIVQDGDKNGSEINQKVGFERRSLDQLSPVDFRTLEQHQPHAQSYPLVPPTHQDFRALERHQPHAQSYALVPPSHQDFRALEQHQPHAQSYAMVPPSHQDFRHIQGYHHQSVIMPLGYASPAQNEWYQSPGGSHSPNEWTLVGHEGMFLISIFIQGVTTVPSTQRVVSV